MGHATARDGNFHRWTFPSWTHPVLLRRFDRCFFLGYRMTEPQTLAKITVVVLEPRASGLIKVSSCNHTTGEAFDADSRVYEAGRLSRRYGAVGRDDMRDRAGGRRR